MAAEALKRPNPWKDLKKLPALSWVVLIIMLVLAGFVIYFVYLLGTAFVQGISKNPSDFAIVSITVGGTVITGLIVTSTRRIVEKKQELESDLRKEQREVYSEFMMLFQGITHGEYTELERKQKFQELGPKIIFWWSDEAIKLYNQIRTLGAGASNNQELVANTMLLWGRLLVRIRKDLGHRKTKLKESDLMGVLMKSGDQEVTNE